MGVEELKKLLEKTDDKLKIFVTNEILFQYSFNIGEFIDLINEYLSDTEKARLFDFPSFNQNVIVIKREVLSNISDSNIKLQMICKDKVTSEFTSDDIMAIVCSLDDEAKQKILLNDDFMEKWKFEGYEVSYIMESMNDEAKMKMLFNTSLITDKLKLSNYDVVTLAKGIQSDEIKSKIIDIYGLQQCEAIDIIASYSDEKKLKELEKMISSKDNGIPSYFKMDIMRLLSIDKLCDFIKNNKESLIQNEIEPFKLVMELSTEKQLEFIENLENMDLTLDEKIAVLANLKKEAKEGIKQDELPDIYKRAIAMETSVDYRTVVLNLDVDLETYRGLDSLLRINPENFTEEQREKFLQLCDICPNMQVINNLNEKREEDENGKDKILSDISKLCKYSSTAKEYKEAEEWISKLISSVNPEYSDLQKLAIVNNAIGKKVSYSADFDTEVFNEEDSRALWKIISSGYGVCNGISKVEQYVLSRLGIESEMVFSDNHAFLKIKDIELPLENGEMAKGDTIVDPTWDLAANRYGYMPNFFCVNYEEIRKCDISKTGKDNEYHKNDEELKDVTLSLSDKKMRELFKSIGLVDKDGYFPLKVAMMGSKTFHDIYANKPVENIEHQLKLIERVCPEFAECQNETIKLLSNSFLKSPNLQYEQCVVSRVYDKSDESKRPHIYVYADLEGIGKKFYIADSTEGKFVEMGQREFDEKYECYDRDLKRMMGIKPWERMTDVKKNIDLSRNSSKSNEEDMER